VSRPVYERNVDLWNEHAVAHAIAGWSGAEVKKTPRMYPLDFAIVRNGDVVALAECKVRTNPMQQYPTYMLSAHKAISARTFAAYLGVPAYLFVRWSCGSIGYINLSTPHDRLAIGGRSDRNDEQDVEPVLHWQIKYFRKLADVKAA
jgi:hypothetical protein